MEYKKKQEEGELDAEPTFIGKDKKLPARSSMKHQVFFSYSRKEAADCLCEILKENAIVYWIDKEGIYSSSNYKELIVDAIDVSQAVIFISSANSNTSINVIREVGYAVNMNKPILPLVLDDAPYAKSIRLDISDIDQIDFSNPAMSSNKLITSLMYVVNK
ncbi:toll/interleukin-1 receptor domain-containing protein [Segatella sinensis]|uniref:Toll/interleukin-1 receptor domain-containing protein n=1 Tax=Segatella sinensis TaxID=3085167 RepID=A0ABV1FWG4_9BACT